MLTTSSLHDLGLQVGSVHSPRTTQEEPASSDNRSKQTGLDDTRPPGVRSDAVDSDAIRETSAVSSLQPLRRPATAKDAPSVSDSAHARTALAQVSASTAVGTQASAATEAVSMQDSQRSAATGDAAAPGAVAASPPTHNRFCPPHGAKAICGRRARMEDAYTAVPFLLEVPMPGSGLPLEVRCRPTCLLMKAACQNVTCCFALCQRLHASSLSGVYDDSQCDAQSCGC